MIDGPLEAGLSLKRESVIWKTKIVMETGK